MIKKQFQIPDSFGDTFLGFCIGLILLYIFFYGTPDVIDAIIKIILIYAKL